MVTCEETLIGKAAHGDTEAFRMLWEAHHAIAMAAAIRLCHQHALAEEITQGAFLLAWRGLPRFRAGQPFRPWLMRIVYRHALDVLETQRRHLRPISLDESLTVGNDASLDVEEQLAQRDEIHRALAQLNAQQRRVIALRYGADLSEVDIAHVLGWPIGTVKSRLNRARERLRTLLRDEQ